MWTWIKDNIFNTYAMYTLYGLIAVGMSAFSLIWTKYRVQWLLAVAVLGLAVVLYQLGIKDLDPQLPWYFIGTDARLFKIWVFALGTLALCTTTHLVSSAVRHYMGNGTATDTSGSPFADIDAAWQEVRIQMSRARIDMTKQHIYILLAPDEMLAGSVIGAAGLQFFARAPSSVESPLHAYAVTDALFLSCAGMYASARPASVPAEAAPAEAPPSNGAARLEHLCQLILAESPELPTLRGIAVLVPFEWVRSGDALLQVSAIRDDLQTIRQVIKVRCPVVTVLCVKDSLPGFNEFTARLPTRERQQRCGFSVPPALAVDGNVCRRGIDWLSHWFELWSLSLMVGDVRNTRGNCRLLAMNLSLRENRTNLVGLLESALTLHSQAEPLLYTGCYFVGYGEPDRSAFAPGLLNGARKGKLIVDRHLTRWSRDSDRNDRRYHLAALLLGLGTITVAGLIWVYQIIQRVWNPGSNAAGWAAIVCLVLLGLMWVVVPPVVMFRRPAAPRTTS